MASCSFSGLTMFTAERSFSDQGWEQHYSMVSKTKYLEGLLTACPLIKNLIAPPRRPVTFPTMCRFMGPGWISPCEGGLTSNQKVVVSPIVVMAVLCQRAWLVLQISIITHWARSLVSSLPQQPANHPALWKVLQGGCFLVSPSLSSSWHQLYCRESHHPSTDGQKKQSVLS